MKAFAVGEKVTIYGSSIRRELYDVLTVVKITKLCITLSDGSKWNARTHQRWGCGKDSWYTGPWIREHKESDDDAVRLIKLRRIVEAVKWPELPVEVLEPLVELLKAHKVA